MRAGKDGPLPAIAQNRVWSRMHPENHYLMSAINTRAQLSPILANNVSNVYISLFPIGLTSVIENSTWLD